MESRNIYLLDSTERRQHLLTFCPQSWRQKVWGVFPSQRHGREERGNEDPQSPTQRIGLLVHVSCAVMRA